jgi:hypothetical protein
MLECTWAFEHSLQRTDSNGHMFPVAVIQDDWGTIRDFHGFACKCCDSKGMIVLFLCKVSCTNEGISCECNPQVKVLEVDCAFSAHDFEPYPQFLL